MRSSLRRRGWLVEALSGKVKISMGNYVQDIKDYVMDLVDWSRERAQKKKEKYDYTEKEAREDIARLIRETKKNMRAVASEVIGAAKRAENWMGSDILVKPHYWKEKGFGGGTKMSLEPITSANVRLYSGAPKRLDPDFTYFEKGELDDVLDAGDQDFFRGKPKVEADYFVLILELRHPGSTKRAGGRPLLLYTARPKSERGKYEKAKVVPSGIFLTTNFDRALGIGFDLGGNKGRDIYKVRLDPRYAIKTLDTGRVQDYQAVSPGKSVPVLKIERI